MCWQRITSQHPRLFARRLEVWAVDTGGEVRGNWFDTS
jgi:hypothetical protein